MFKFTLVPSGFFEKDTAEKYLASVVLMNEDFPVQYKELPQYRAVLVYYGEEERASLMIREISSLSGISYFNKVLVYAPGNGMVDILIAVGKELKIVNSFHANDPVTALYYIISCMEQFGIEPRPVVLNIFADDGLGISCLAERLFKGVEVVQ